MLVVKTNSRINANQTYAHMKIIKENYKESPNEISMIKVNDDNYFQVNKIIMSKFNKILFFFF